MWPRPWSCGLRNKWEVIVKGASGNNFFKRCDLSRRVETVVGELHGVE